jgi:hypothetical protein
MGSTERDDRHSSGQGGPTQAPGRQAQATTEVREHQSRWRYTSAIEAARALGGSQTGLRVGVA